MHGFSFNPIREKRLAWRNMGSNPDVPQQGDSIQESNKLKQEGLNKPGGMVKWLHKANEKFREGTPGFTGEKLKDMVEKALAQGDVDQQEIRSMKLDILDVLEQNLTGDEIKQFLKDFPTDEEALLGLWKKAGLITYGDIKDFSRAETSASSSDGQNPRTRRTPPEGSPLSGSTDPSRKSTPVSGSQGRTDWAAKAETDRNELKAKRAGQEEERRKMLDKDPAEALQGIRGEMTGLLDKIQRLQDESKDYIQQKRMNRPGIRGRYIRGSKYGQMEKDAYAEYGAKLRSVNIEAAKSEERYAYLDRLHRELTKSEFHRDGQHFGEWRRMNDADYDEKISARHEQQQKLAEQMDKDYKKRYATKDDRTDALMGWERGTMASLRNVPSESDMRFREHMSRAGGSVDGMSGYIDSTGKDAEYLASLKGGKGGGGSKHNPYEGYSAFQPYGSDQERNQYLRKQNKLRQKYIPELTDFVADNLPTVKDDPNYERINKAFNRAMEHWKDDPDRAYGDLAIMRSQIQYMQKRGRFQKLMDAFRASLGEERVKKLPHVSVASPGGRYFAPGEKVHITIPAELLPYSAGKDLTVHYEPFTVMGAEDDSQVDALFDAGILIERSEALLGKYPDGRGRVRGLKIYFTKPGAYKINGKEANVIQGSNQSPGHQSPGSFRKNDTIIT